MTNFFTSIMLIFLLSNNCFAQETRTNQPQNLLVTNEGMMEIVSYELIFSSSTCNSEIGNLKLFVNHFRRNLIEQGLNVHLSVDSSGNGIILFDTASTISLETINSWLESQGVQAIELKVKIEKN